MSEAEKIDKKESVISLANGRSLRYGHTGDLCVDMYIRLCAANGRELRRWYLSDFVNSSESQAHNQLIDVLQSIRDKKARKS